MNHANQQQPQLSGEQLTGYEKKYAAKGIKTFEELRFESFEPHQRRVILECDELDERVRKLQLFVESKPFCSIDAIEKMLLKSQLYAMLGYREALWMRIQKFTNAVERASF